MQFIKKYREGIILTVIYFIVLFLTLSHYGMHEDNPFHFLRGQAYLQKILTGEPQFNIPNIKSPVLFTSGSRISLYKPNASEQLFAPIRPIGVVEENEQTLQQSYRNFINRIGKKSFYKHNAWTTTLWDTVYHGHPAVADTIMAFSNRVFHGALGVIGDVEAYHLIVILAMSIALFSVYAFCLNAFNRTTALFSTISLALFPFLFAESHFNIKDITQMSFFTMAIVSFYFFILAKSRIKWFAVFVFVSFLSLGTKWNVLFLPFIILPWLFLIRKKKELSSSITFRNVVFFGLLATVLAFVLLIMSWPFLWTRPIPKLFEIFGFYSKLAVRDPRVEIASFAPLAFGLDARAIIMIASMTPPIMLLFFMMGAVMIFWRKIKSEYKAQWLVAIWLVVPLLRVIWQNASIYGSIRNFVEFLPAFAIIAGIGGNWIISKFEILNFKFKKNLPVIIILIYSLYLGWINFRIHPNQNLYFNFLIGGIKGAGKVGVYGWYSSYHNVYRQGVNWLNAHVPQKAKLAYLDGTMLAISPLWLRDDIRFGSYFSGFEQKGEYVISLVYPDPPAVFEYLYLDRFLDPVFAVKLDEVSVLKVWKNSKNNLKSRYKKERELEKNFKIDRYLIQNKKIWEVKLGESQKITKVILTFSPKNCYNKDVVWSTIKNGHESYIKPKKIQLIDGRVEFDFPAQEGDTIRFWDVEKNSCFYQSEVDKFFVL